MSWRGFWRPIGYVFFAVGVVMLAFSIFIMVYLQSLTSSPHLANPIVSAPIPLMIVGIVFIIMGAVILGTSQEEEKRPSTRPNIPLSLPQPSLPPPPQAVVCPSCGTPLAYISNYQRWYCYKCQKYV